MNKLIIYFFTFLCFLFFSCDDDNDDLNTSIAVPSDYTFEREGTSTVDFSGQTARLDMLAAIKAYLLKADGGEQIEADVLNNMFENQSNAFESDDLNNSGKQIKSKTFAPDLDSKYFENAFDAVAIASLEGLKGTTASKGNVGLLKRSNGNTILVDGNGKEFTQIIEKGLMGSLMLNQIFNVYLTDDRIGNSVENDETEPDANYTAMEHHWDEAFGYFGVTVNFPENKEGVRFWGNYSNGRDELIGTNEAIMDAYLAGRTAIVNKNYTERDLQRDILYEQLELVAAATAVHYLNDALSAFGNGETGDAFHVLSEAWEFIRALRTSPQKKISLEQINTILNEVLGSNFWDITISGINEAKATLVSAYPSLADVKDVL
ncbi:MAG: DUF4856 domain-containing protein [Bacteroidota bacterium]